MVLKRVLLGAQGYEKRNPDGDKLLEMCLKNSLTVCNSVFHKSKSKKITRYCWDGKSTSVIDYFIINKDKVNQVRDVEIKQNIAMDRAHRLLVAKVRKRKFRKSKET